ncbi:hypothetical protein PENTCL1PPCAC_22421, partial [Pristionchus entomophagus]
GKGRNMRLPILLCLLLRHTLARGFNGIPGDYCSKRAAPCCLHRDDDCTAPILGDHLCYCDVFCDRGPDGGNDCCPDFLATCKGVQPENTQEFSLSGRECSSDGIRYLEGETTKNNCKTCTCSGGVWSCDRKTCLIQDHLLHEIQHGRYTWSGSNYSIFWGRTLEEGIKYRLGTLFPEQSVQHMNEIVIKPRELPDYFDAREKWPGLIHGVKDQGDCASSWAVSTTDTSQDRLAIITDGRLNESLSSQQLLSCNQHRQKGCEGGYLDRAWWYIRKIGVVSESCYPYESGVTREPGICMLPKTLFQANLPISCPNENESKGKVFRMTPPYRVSPREEDIMTEIISNGPVQATFVVHEDFFMYKHGVYQHTHLAADKGDSYTGQGYHSVRVLGWGTDHSTGRPVKYWLCANSWGPNWGENGFFRILRGENHCEIESFVLGAWGKGAKRRRRFKLRKLRRRFKKRLF